MEIIDRRGYLQEALEYIERNIVFAKAFQKISKKSGISETSIKSLSTGLKGFSEKYLFTLLQEEIERSHSSLSGANAEVSGADVSLEIKKSAAFICIMLSFDIVVDGEIEDKLKICAKVFSKKNIDIA